MKLARLNKEELNQLVYNLKAYEINQCRIKIIQFTQNLKEQPNQKILAIRLKIALERLEYLLSS